MVIGFMVVTVEQYQVARGQQRVEHHFVRRGGAVEHEVGFIGVKDFCRMLLGNAWRPFVDQQVTHGDVGVAQVGAEQRLAEILDELITGRMTAEEFTPLMPRAVKGAVALFNVIDQRAKEWRTQFGFIFMRSGFQLAAVKVVAGFVVFKYPLHRSHIFGRDHLFFINSDKYRDVIAGGL